MCSCDCVLGVKKKRIQGGLLAQATSWVVVKHYDEDPARGGTVLKSKVAVFSHAAHTQWPALPNAVFAKFLTEI